MADAQGKYLGQELDLFAHAHNWKRYFRRMLAPYIGRRVAEVGAGNGSTAEILSVVPHDVWLALEPDAQLFAMILAKKQQAQLPGSIVPVRGTSAELASHGTFDTILYVDVLEHIENDFGELQNVSRSLSPGGRVVVLAPAYQALYTPFDAAIGHYRRYTLNGLKRLTPPGMRLERGFYLDSVGMLASLANRLLLQQSMPNIGQVMFWDRVLVPCSRLLDPLTGRLFGKTVVAIWCRDAR